MLETDETQVAGIPCDNLYSLREPYTLPAAG